MFIQQDCPFEKIYPSALKRDVKYFMTYAYNEAIEAWKKDEVPVGAVIEYNGQIIASAHNQSRSTNDPTAHAEILAISQATKATGDSTNVRFMLPKNLVQCALALLLLHALVKSTMDYLTQVWAVWEGLWT